MAFHIEIFNESGNRKGLILISNIEEVWLDENRDCVSIRYRSPNGNLIDHEEIYERLCDAQFRYAMIEADLVEPNRIIQFDRLERGLKRSES